MQGSDFDRQDWPQPEAGASEPRVYADDSNFVMRYFTKNEKIAFNVGDLTHSVIMKVEDYLKLVDATICSFSKMP